MLQFRQDFWSDHKQTDQETHPILSPAASQAPSKQRLNELYPMHQAVCSPGLVCAIRLISVSGKKLAQTCQKEPAFTVSTRANRP